MKTEQILAALPVADIEKSIAWYGKLFGRKYDDRPMKEAAEWALTSGGGVQLVQDAQRAGRSLLTVSVKDLDALIGDCKTRGLEPKALQNQGPYLLAQITDPDGNLLTFAQPRQS